MDIEQLRTFDRVVRDGSFTKAAARLGITQATVSLRVQALETELGVTLFKRGRHVTLTDKGLNFLPHCRQMLSVLKDARTALRQDHRGRVAIGSLSSMIMPLVSAPLLRLQQTADDLDVVVREGRHEQIANMLFEREVDLALLCWPNLDPLLAHLEPMFVMREDVILVATPEIAQALPSHPTLAQVMKVCRRYFTLNWWQVTPLQATSIAAAAPIGIDLPSVPGLHLVKAGKGTGLFVRSAVADSIANGDLAELKVRDIEPIFRDVALVCRSTDLRQQRHLMHFADEIANEALKVGKVYQDNRPSKR